MLGGDGSDAGHGFTPADYNRLPPTLLLSGSADLCHSDACSFAAAAAGAALGTGRPAAVSLSNYPDMVHTWMLLHKAAAPHAAAAVEEAGRFVRDAVALGVCGEATAEAAAGGAAGG